MVIPEGAQLVDTAGLSAYHDELMSSLASMIANAASPNNTNAFGITDQLCRV